jgi:hypothetical protein
MIALDWNSRTMRKNRLLLSAGSELDKLFQAQVSHVHLENGSGGHEFIVFRIGTCYMIHDSWMAYRMESSRMYTEKSFQSNFRQMLAGQEEATKQLLMPPKGIKVGAWSGWFSVLRL